MASTWVRADWRRRWRSLLVLALLVGVAAGGVMAVTAGARRSATSLERLARASRSSDVLVDVGDGGPRAARQIGALPTVEVASSATLVFAIIDGVEIDIGLFLPRDDALGVDVERDRLLRGRRPDRRRADEVTINEPMATLLDLDVGDELDIRTLTAAQVDAEQYGEPLGPVLHVAVTGVTLGPGDLSARREGNITGTAALYPTVRGAVDEFATYVAVRLRPGVTPAGFERELATIAPAGAPLNVLPSAVRTRPARETISTLAVGLAVAALVTAVGVVVAVAQAVARHVGAAVVDGAAMQALGMVRRQRHAALVATVLPAAAGAPVVAVLVAIIASPLFPFGLARRAEPDPGIRIDGPVLVVGALATTAVVVLAGAAVAAWATRRRQDRALRRPSVAASAAARWGAPPPVVHGVALALDRRPHGRSVRSTLVALGAAVVVAAGSATFAASLDRLAGESGRWGSPWDLDLDFTSAEVGAATEVLVDDDGLAAVGRWDSGAALVDGTFVRAFGLDRLRGDLGFSLVEGRQPRSGEVVVGPGTAARSGLAIGDDVGVARPDGDGVGTLRLVGIALFPDVDDGDFVDAVGLTAPDFAAHAAVQDEFEAFQVVVRIAPGTSLSETEDRLREQFGPSLDGARPVRPGAVGNLVGILSIPQLLVSSAALLGLASLAHAVRSATERRAGDFATLRAVGMTRWQRWCCSLAQSLVLAAVATVAGVPLGIAVGRGAWSSVARSIDVAPDPLVPSAALAALTGGTLVLALLAAAAARRSQVAVVAAARQR